MAEAEPVTSPLPAPRKGWRWRTRIALGVLLSGAALVALVCGVIARPWVAVVPLNWLLLAGTPIQVSCSDARLEMPFGFTAWRRWRWRVTDFALVSKKMGTPTLMADLVIFRTPDLTKSWETNSLAFKKVGAVGFTVFIPASRPPPPFEEKEAWPISGLTIEEGILLDFQLVMRDANGMPIVMDKVNGQVFEFRYDFGHRKMYGHGECQGATIQVGPLEATNLHALPIEFDGTTMLVRGYGSLSHQRAFVLFEIDGLFRAGAAIHAEFEIENADVRSLLHEALADDAPEMDGKLWAKAVIDTRPGDKSIDVKFRLEDATILLPDETKGLILAALKVAPFVELKDHLVRLGPLSGHVAVGDGAIVLTNGLYEADGSTADVDGRMTRTTLRGRVHFVPKPGSAGLNWGLLLGGSAKKPKIQLADPSVLESWSLEGPETAQEIRENVKEARKEEREAEREAKREARKAGRGEPESPGTDSPTEDEEPAPGVPDP